MGMPTGGQRRRVPSAGRPPLAAGVQFSICQWLSAPSCNAVGSPWACLPPQYHRRLGRCWRLLAGASGMAPQGELVRLLQLPVKH